MSLLDERQPMEGFTMVTLVQRDFATKLACAPESISAHSVVRDFERAILEAGRTVERLAGSTVPISPTTSAERPAPNPHR